MLVEFDKDEIVYPRNSEILDKDEIFGEDIC